MATKLTLQLSCYDGSRYLPFLFESLKRQTFRGWKLVALDNASRPEEAEAIRRAVASAGLNAELYRVEENIGFAGAHDFLFAKHASDYVQLLNDDAFLEPEYLERCLAHLEANPDCAAVSGEILRWDFDRRDAPDGGRTDVIDSLGLRRNRSRAVRDIGAGRSRSDFPPLTLPTEVFGVSGCLPMYRVAAVRQASPDGSLFDASYRSYKEDVDLAYRLRATGYTAAIVPGARAYHRRSLGIGAVRPASAEARYLSYRNHLWTLIAHLPTGSWRNEFGAFLYEKLKFLHWALKSPSFLVLAARDTLRAWPRLMKKRAFVKRLRAERPAASLPVPTEVDVAIVTVSHNDLNDAYLESLSAARKATKLKTAVVIVDNASTRYRANELVSRLIPDAVVLLRDGDYGFGRSCNRGAREVRAKCYFFLNPDTVLHEPDILDRLHAYLASHPKTGLVAPKIYYLDGRLQETCRRFPAWYMPFVQRTALKETALGRAYNREFVMADYDHETERSVDWVQGSAMFVRREVWERLGGFDDRYFMYFEDIDLCRRIRLLGLDVAYLPSTSLRHAHGKESARIPGLVRNLLQNEIARAHLASWMRYLVKWRGRVPPSA